MDMSAPAAAASGLGSGTKLVAFLAGEKFPKFEIWNKNADRFRDLAEFVLKWHHVVAHDVSAEQDGGMFQIAVTKAATSCSSFGSVFPPPQEPPKTIVQKLTKRAVRRLAGAARTLGGPENIRKLLAEVVATSCSSSASSSCSLARAVSQEGQHREENGQVGKSFVFVERTRAARRLKEAAQRATKIAKKRRKLDVPNHQALTAARDAEDEKN